MSDEDILKRIMDFMPEGRKGTGRPQIRWIDGVLEGIKKLRLKNWWRVASVREAWNKVLRKAEAHTGLYRYWRLWLFKLVINLVNKKYKLTLFTDRKLRDRKALFWMFSYNRNVTRRYDISKGHQTWWLLISVFQLYYSILAPRHTQNNNHPLYKRLTLQAQSEYVSIHLVGYYAA